MQQPTLTSYFKAKKPSSAPADSLKAPGKGIIVVSRTENKPVSGHESTEKEIVPEDILKPSEGSQELAQDGKRVQFVKKGNLSPSKKKTVQPVDLKRLKAVARNFKDTARKLEKLREQRRELEQQSSPKKRTREEVKEPAPSPQKVTARTTAPEEITLTPLVAHPSLQLPLRFRVLKLLNEGMNTVASMFQNRSETISFNKLKPAVESMTKHTFSIKSAARMLTLDSYFKILTQKVDNVNQYVFEFQVKLLPSQLLRLKKSFESNLLQFCLVEHDKFLRSQNIEVDRHLVTRWHPSFNLDALQVPAAALPDLNERLTSAAEVLSQVREMMQSKQLAGTTKLSPVKKPPVSKKALKGVSASLLEKIRDREKSRIVRDLTIPEEEVKIQKIKARLPELVRTIHNIFIGEKKAAIEFPTFVKRLHFSYQKLSTNEIELHVDYLVKTQPDWIQKIKTSSGDYIKINKAIQVKDLSLH